MAAGYGRRVKDSALKAQLICNNCDNVREGFKKVILITFGSDPPP